MCGCSRVSAQKIIDGGREITSFWIVAAGGVGLGEIALDTVEILEIGPLGEVIARKWLKLGRLQMPRYQFPTVGLLPDKGLLYNIFVS